MKKISLASLSAFLKNPNKKFQSRKSFIYTISCFDPEIQRECLNRLGQRTKVTCAISHGILGDALIATRNRRKQPYSKDYPFCRIKNAK